MQIPMSLTDEAWDLLRPKLVSQVPEAQRREREDVAASAALSISGGCPADMDDPDGLYA